MLARSWIIRLPFINLPPSARGAFFDRMHRYLLNLAICLAAGLSTLSPPGSALAGPAASLTTALEQRQTLQKEAVASQQRIDTLDDESRALLEEFRGTRTELDNLQGYNTQMARMVSAQEQEVVELEAQLQEIEITKRRILPLMVRMVEVLEQFIALDGPFLPRERRLRMEGLKELLDDPHVGLTEKYRRILEAYRVENAYAYNIEAYAGELTLGGRTRTVDFLRLGRVGLYYLTFDQAEAGYWDPGAESWKPLDESYRQAIEQGIRVARKQAPPELIKLPVPAPEGAL